MRLLYNEYSPFARKARVVALICEAELELVQVNPHADEWIREHNPFCKIPVLVLDDGISIFDSRVIVEYLAENTRADLVMPSKSRLRCLQQQAIGDGICDAAVALRAEVLRPQREQSAAFKERQIKAIQMGLAAAVHTDLSEMNVGTISIACALDYLDVRHCSVNWRGANPSLERWHSINGNHPALMRTAPPKATA